MHTEGGQFRSLRTVVSLLSDDLDALAASIARQAPLADLVELRLDRIGHPGEGRLGALIENSPKPVIVTVHGREAHGTFRGSTEERCALLGAAARAGADFVDVDWTLARELGAVEPPCRRIVSRHDPEGTPEDLEAFEREVRGKLLAGDLLKLVAHAHTGEEACAMLARLRPGSADTIAFSSGAAGTFTRLVAPILGSPFTYAAPARLRGDEGLDPTAPGQLAVDELRHLVPPGGVTRRTAVYGVVGRPIAHSASPAVHGAALRAAGLDAVYVAFEPADFDRFLDLLDASCYRGLSVTAPFKERAFARASERDAASVRAGASNTLVRDGGRWRAFNTDVPAVRGCLEDALEGRERPRRALVLGGGGAARAVAVALEDLGIGVAFCVRDPDRSRESAATVGAEVVPWERLPEIEHGILVNTTPLGWGETPASPIPEEWIRPGTLLLDATYRPLETPLLAAASRRGCHCIPGAEWFARQAAEQFRLFAEREPDEGAMRSALDNLLA